MKKVTLKRMDKGLDNYLMVIRGTIDRIIRISDRNTLIDIYKHGLCHDGSEQTITWTIDGQELTLDWDTSRWVFGTVEEWFWDYVDSAESRSMK